MLKTIYKTTFRTLTTTADKKKLFNELPFKPFKPLQQIAPTFYTNGNNIKPLYEPSDFYAQLKQNILSAKERVFIAALYIGQSEQELVDTIRLALKKSPQLKVHVLIDCLRGTRVSKGQSSATLLLPLVQDFPDQINISMYHTPDLTGILKKTIPQRFNETIGLMHLKVYGFDNTVMLSGANLSTDYFTNRQDRYIMFNNQPELSTYYYDLVKLISNNSYQLLPSTETAYKLSIVDNDVADPVKESRKYKYQMNQKINQFIEDTYKNSTIPNQHIDTAVLPVIQMGPFHIRQDEKLTLELLTLANKQVNPWIVHLTSGYFNFTEKYKSFILKTRARFRFLTASPEANGFFNSKGVSRFLPPAYTYIERQFYKHVKKSNRQSEITIEEYKRPGWTYHAKGLWINLENDQYPSATMIGSPNFGQRSSERDLEAQALVITNNDQLRKALHKEVDLLHQYSELVSNETFDKIDRKVPNGVKIATKFVKTML